MIEIEETKDKRRRRKVKRTWENKKKYRNIQIENFKRRKREGRETRRNKKSKP